MAYENIIVETHGRVGKITLNRPKALNALNAALMNELSAAVEAFDKDRNIGCILLTGSEKAFAAGADIKEMQSFTYPGVYLDDFIAAWERLSRARKPAVAAVAGAPAAGLEDRCGRTLPVSLIVFQGTHDPLMPYDGGITAARRGQVLSAERTAALFASVNSCPHTVITSFEPDTATDGTRVRRTRYDGCPEGRDVVLYSIEGGGHTWPGTPIDNGNGTVTQEINANTLMWQFFRRHRLRGF